MDNEKLLQPLTLKDLDLPDNVVAAAVYVEAGETSHAAIIIRHGGNTRVLHFIKNVLLELPTEAMEGGIFIFIKNLDFISPSLIPSLLRIVN